MHTEGYASLLCERAKEGQNSLLCVRNEGSQKGSEGGREWERKEGSKDRADCISVTFV